MKVNISYAVELSDIPAEVGKLITNVEHQISMLLDEVENIATSNPTKAIKSITEVREGLSNLDLRLSDCFNILSGYVDLQNKSSAETPNSEEEDDQ